MAAHLMVGTKKDPPSPKAQGVFLRPERGPDDQSGDRDAIPWRGKRQYLTPY
jgi:hypothetical protein